MHPVLKVGSQVLIGMGAVMAFALVVTTLVAWGQAMPEHGYFFIIFLAPIAGCTYLACCGVRLLFRRLHYGQNVADPQRLSMPINQMYFRSVIPALIGLLLALNYILTGMGTAHVRGVLQSILPLTFVPFTMALSYLLLGYRPVMLELVGGGTVICGALVSMIPDWISPPCQKNVTDFEMACYGINNTASVMSESKCFRLHRSGSEIAWDYLYLFSVPLICSTGVLLEFFLKKRDFLRIPSSSQRNGEEPLISEDSRQRHARDSTEDATISGDVVGELNFFLAIALIMVYLAIFLAALIWVNVIPGVVPSCENVTHSFKTLAQNLRVAWRCTFYKHGGYENNLTRTYSSPLNSSLAGLHHPDTCTHAVSIFVAQQIATTVLLCLLFLMVREHSATFSMAVTTIGPVLSAFLQMSPVLSFGYHSYRVKDAAWFSWAGLVIVLLGILIYKAPSVSAVTDRYPHLAARSPDESKSILNRWLDKKLIHYARRTGDMRHRHTARRWAPAVSSLYRLQESASCDSSTDNG